MTSDDMTLVRDYAESSSEEAFSTLVAQHIDLVYSVALRRARDPHMAEEITQSVFIILARKAQTLSPKTILSGWLCRTARYVSADTLKLQRRRKLREQELQMQPILNDTQSDAWNQIAPLLDEALNCLEEKEHDAIVLRFFDGKEFKQVAAEMGMREDAARMRVNRGLEKLRNFFINKGVTLSGSAIAGAVSANSVQAAPIGLAVTVTTAAEFAGAAMTITATAGATKTITMTTFQKALISVTIVAAIGAGVYEANQNSILSDQVHKLRQQNAPLLDRIRAFEQNRDDAENKLTALQQENNSLRSNLSELPKLRGEVARLRANTQRQTDDPVEADMRSWLVRASKLKQRAAETPQAKIPEMRLLDETAYMSAARSILDTEEDYLRALANLRSAAEGEFIRAFLNPALTQYAQANAGQFPTNLSQLQPYFPSPVEDAILDRWEIAPADTVRTDYFGDQIITQKAAVDEDWDPRYAVGLNGWASAGHDTAGHNGWGVIQPEVILGPAFKAAAEAFAAANNGQTPTELSQALPYLKLTTPEEQAALQKMMKWRQKK